jgi:hypothetical protein
MQTDLTGREIERQYRLNCLQMAARATSTSWAFQ